MSEGSPQADFSLTPYGEITTMFISCRDIEISDQATKKLNDGNTLRINAASGGYVISLAGFTFYTSKEGTAWISTPNIILNVGVNKFTAPTRIYDVPKENMLRTAQLLVEWTQRSVREGFVKSKPFFGLHF